MTDDNDIRDDLIPETEDDLLLLAERLRHGRPVPRPAFRGDLGRLLAARGHPQSSLRRIRAMAASCALGGMLLLSIGTLSAAGLGPLA